MTRVNLDKDLQPNNQSEIYHASETMSATYGIEDAFLGSMSARRIETSLQAHRNTTSPEVGDFLQAVAKLIARYKDGTHTVAFKIKNCYTATPSLTTDLISALGATSEQFAMPFDFNPKMKHYSAPLAEDAEFGLTQMRFLSSGRAASTVTQNPRTSRC